MSSYEFTVIGKPAGKGSKRIGRTRAGRPIVLDDNARTKPWQSQVQAAAIEAMGIPAEPFRGPVSVSVVIQIARPKGHYGTGKNAGKLKDNAPYWCLSKPDCDKVVRTVLDALTGVAYHDDSQCGIDAPVKTYGPRDQVTIRVIQRKDKP